MVDKKGLLIVFLFLFNRDFNSWGEQFSSFFTICKEDEKNLCAFSNKEKLPTEVIFYFFSTTAENNETSLS